LAEESLRAGLGMLRERDVRTLFVSYLVTYTGTAMAPIAIAFGVLDLTGSTADASFVIAAPTFASIAVLLIGGVLADRTSRRTILALAEVVAMLSQGTIAALFLTGLASVPILTALMLVNGLAMGFNAPASAGLVVQIVDREALQTVNALLGLARNGAVTGGAALGGILVAAFGAGPTLAIDAASFGVSALLVLSLRPRRQEPPARASIVRDLVLGWREFTAHTWLWVIVLQFSVMVAAFESVFGLMGPAVAREYLGGARAWGWIAGSFGAGTLLGGLVSMRVDVRYPMRIATLCTFTWCAVPLCLSVPLPAVLVAAAAFVQGVTGQTFAVLWYTTLQQKIPSQMLSRVSAYDHLGSISLAPLGIVAAGFLFEQIGYRASMWIAAAAILGPAAAAISVRDVRDVTSRDDPIERT